MWLNELTDLCLALISQALPSFPETLSYNTFHQVWVDLLVSRLSVRLGRAPLHAVDTGA